MKIPDRLTPARFGAAVDRVVARAIKRVSPAEVPKLLYHYTDPPGFMGIVQSRKLFATHKDFMNDRREAVHAFDMLRHVLGLDKDFHVAARLLEENDVTLREGYYVTCLSERADSLGQWRAYGGDGLGFALGLNVEAIPKSNEIGVTDAPFRLPLVVRVVYDDQTKLDLLTVAREMALCARQLSEEYQRMAFAGAQRLMSIFAVTFKHAAFADEHEWRLVWLGVGSNASWVWPKKFRVTRYGLGPYMEWPLERDGRLLLQEVRLGPKNRDLEPRRPDTSLRACREFLDAHGCSAQVFASDAPYR